MKENLISGKEALIALFDGLEVQGNVGGDWIDITVNQKLSIHSFMKESDDLGRKLKLRLKPKTIKINGVEYSSKSKAIKFINEVFK